MKRYAFSVLIFFLLVSASSVNAAETWHSGKITRVYPLANGSVVFSLDTDAPTCTNTSKPKYFYLQVGQNGVTAQGLQNILAAGLAAAAQGKTVGINFDDATQYCYVNRINVIY
ncbi:MAG: hypothetical protein ACK4E7_04370 [Permianibacter sp.]